MRHVCINTGTVYAKPFANVDVADYAIFDGGDAFWDKSVLVLFPVC